mgnify:CR=1 FL=1
MGEKFEIEISVESIDISNFNYEKYFDEDILETSTEEFENNNSKLIKQAYINNIQEDIKKKLDKKEQGFSLIMASLCGLVVFQVF